MDRWQLPRVYLVIFTIFKSHHLIKATFHLHMWRSWSCPRRYIPAFPRIYNDYNAPISLLFMMWSRRGACEPHYPLWLFQTLVSMLIRSLDSTPWQRVVTLGSIIG
jgi:hypothetical protein